MTIFTSSAHLRSPNMAKSFAYTCSVLSTHHHRMVSNISNRNARPGAGVPEAASLQRHDDRRMRLALSRSQRYAHGSLLIAIKLERSQRMR